MTRGGGDRQLMHVFSVYNIWRVWRVCNQTVTLLGKIKRYIRERIGVAALFVNKVPFERSLGATRILNPTGASSIPHIP